MSRTRRVAFAIFLIAAAAHAQSSLRTLTLHSRALAENLTGDPADQRYAVYLPSGYDSGTQRYPVIFLLHGIADSSDTWINDFKVPQMLDRLIASKQIAPVIVVMPNARNRFLGSYYLNSSVTGRWSDFIADEMVAAVDSRFRTLAKSSSRAVMGHSMGGFGAIHFGMTRSDVFSVVYAISPCCLDAVEDVGAGNVSAWMSFLSFKTPDDADAALQKGQFYPVAITGLLSAMVPNPSAPLHADVPFRVERGELVRVHPAYERWLAQFPVHAVAADRENLLKLRALAIDFGFDDQFAHIPPSVMSFSRALFDNRIAHRLDVYPGDHREKVEERLERVVFPFVSAALEH